MNRPINNRIPRGTWRDRFMGMDARPMSLRAERSLPKWMLGNSVLAFIIALAACSMAFGYTMSMQFMVFSILSVLLFFYGVSAMSKGWATDKDGAYVKNLLIWAIAIRIVWVLYSYFFYNEPVYGKPDGFGDDNGWYMDFAKGIAGWFKGENRMPFSDLMNFYRSSVDDTGYPVWLAILYLISGESSDIFLPMLVKALLSAYSCLCIYRVAKRHFGEGTARIAGLFMCLNPYMLFWCSSMLKETEMIFLCCLFVDQTDKALSANKGTTFRGLLPGLLAGAALFFFRAPLAIVAFLSIFTHVVFVSRRVMSSGKKILAGVLVGIVLLVGMGERLRTQAQSVVSTVQSDTQQSNMEWRSTRKGGNAFAKYAGAAVFAPLIFTLPFPTFNMANEDQIMQLEMSGANYIKNILSFFVIIVMIRLLISGEWRRHVFILAYTLGYLAMLVLSTFAQGARFHMPVMPMLLLFAAFGIQVAKGNKRMQRWFSIALVVEVVACLAWNWFKLKGRGMI